MSDLIKNPQFVKTAIWPEDYPNLKDKQGNPVVEIAVVGRSNVGKSSLLNHLFRRKNLVKTSAQPGKTQAINFFSTAGDVAFVDLPGYGFAKVPFAVKKQWGPMVQKYLEGRSSLGLILFLLDIRRKPSEDDKQLMEWIIHTKKPFLLLLTKADKLNQKEKHKQIKLISSTISATDVSHITYSIKDPRCRVALEEALNNRIKEPS